MPLLSERSFRVWRTSGRSIRETSIFTRSLFPNIDSYICATDAVWLGSLGVAHATPQLHCCRLGSRASREQVTCRMEHKRRRVRTAVHPFHGVRSTSDEDCEVTFPSLQTVHEGYTVPSATLYGQVEAVQERQFHMLRAREQNCIGIVMNT